MNLCKLKTQASRMNLPDHLSCNSAILLLYNDQTVRKQKERFISSLKCKVREIILKACKSSLGADVFWYSATGINDGSKANNLIQPSTFSWWEQNTEAEHSSPNQVIPRLPHTHLNTHSIDSIFRLPPSTFWQSHSTLLNNCGIPPPSTSLSLRPVGGSNNLLNLLQFTLRTWIKELLNCTDVAASRSDWDREWGERER